jgi:hypothetical protein
MSVTHHQRRANAVVIGGERLKMRSANQTRMRFDSTALATRSPVKRPGIRRHVFSVFFERPLRVGT